MPEQPTVGIAVPVLDEAAHIAQVAADILAQDYPGLREIWFVDGGSTDGTIPILAEIARGDDRIRLLHNERCNTAAALNLAFAGLRSDILIRFDAHARYAPDVARCYVAALLATGAGGVGAIARPMEASTDTGRGIVAAHRSRFGLGGAKFRDEGASGWVESVWNGGYWRHVVERTGPLREDLWRAEDNDFNERVRRQGYGLFLCPEAHAYYQPRQSLGALWRQYMGNGAGVARAAFENYRAFGLRHFIPFALVMGILAPLPVALFWPPAALVSVGVAGLYLLVLLVATLEGLRTVPGLPVLSLPAALATLHFAYGIGFLRGLAAQVRGRLRRPPAERASRIAGVVLLGLAFGSPGEVASAQVAMWFAPSMDRIARDGLAVTKASMELFSARGETESFQLAIRAPQSGLTNVTVRIGDLVSEEGARIAARQVEFFRVDYVTVRRGSPDWRGSNRPLGLGRYPDPLTPLASPSGDASFAVPASLTQPVWADIQVPQTAQPGRYRAEIVVVSDQGRVVGEVTLVVWAFALPASPALDSLFIALRRNNPQAATELLKHRLMPHPLVSLDADPHQQPMLRERWGLKSASIGLWSGATIEDCTMAPPPSAATVAEAVASRAPGLQFYNFTADEIDRCPAAREPLKAWARTLHAAGVLNLVTMTPVPELYDDGSGQGRSAVDIWVLLPAMYDAAQARVAEVMRRGDRVWSYNALVQDDYSPKWQIDFAPINYRIMPGFMSAAMHLTGLLYWSVDRWTSDAWEDVQTYRNRDGYDFPGEGMLLYPDRRVGEIGVVPSMRLKWLRDGVDDYDYIHLLRQAGCTGQAAAAVAPVAVSWRNWTKDRSVLEGQRRILGSLLDRIAKGELVCGTGESTP
ncbi:glycosyltransferase [Belnapia sp. T18]|uniref:Glycosyltransferase n=1 Tax=Belnapia arida TaxID=2804533 RepID=A0ABS1U9H6_9PROT|nr:glycosyltransferase [Belnapia arida]MBL6081180.1 glycosyltransferase [Belnapia arida]